MATIIGTKHAQKFNRQAYKKLVQENSGSDLTTDRIIKGIESVWDRLEADPSQPLEKLKASPLYITGTDEG